MLKTLILKNLFVLPDKTNIKLWGSFIAWPSALPPPSHIRDIYRISRVVTSKVQDLRRPHEIIARIGMKAPC